MENKRQFSLLVLFWSVTVAAVASLVLRLGLGPFAAVWICFYGFFAWFGLQAVFSRNDERTIL